MHHDDMSCLHNIWLRNGYELDPCGTVHYCDPEGFVRAVALELSLAPHRLAPEGTCYLRLLLDMNQTELDRVLEAPPGTVAACERGSQALSAEHSRMLRLLALEAVNPAALAPQVPEQPLEPAQKLVFEHVDGRWHCCGRVTVAALLSDLPPSDFLHRGQSACH
jgi:DNA-binding transcriptional regulator YiaG